MATKVRNYSELVEYLKKRGISPQDNVDIIEKTTPEAQEDNKRFNWKMFRFTMFLWERIKEEKKRNLLSKTDTAKEVVKSKKYKDLYEAFNTTKLNPEKEAKNLFKLVTDPRQKPYFVSRYFVYEGRPGKNIPQDHINLLMKFPKSP